MEGSKTMNKKHVTIYDIAREAEVSPATVSRILRGSSYVSEEKRRRVTQLIEKYNFRPNAAARALTKTQTRLVGMVMADVGNPYHSSLFTACVAEAHRRGYATMMFNTLSRPEMEEEAVLRLLEQRVDAIIISGGSIDREVLEPDFVQLLETAMKNVPIIAASRSKDERIFGVEVDHVGSVDLAMAHLLALGHRDIGFIYSGAHNYGTQEKLGCFRRHMEAAGLPVREEWLIDVVDYSCEAGRLGAERLVRLPVRPTAVICMNDLVASGVMQGLHASGVRIPQDISIVGFDNTFITQILSPQLTSVGYDYNVYAAMLMDAVTASIDGQHIGQNRRVPAMLSVKETTSQPMTAGI